MVGTQSIPSMTGIEFEAGSKKATAPGDFVYFSNPTTEKRERLTLRESASGGVHWERWTVLHNGPSGYSSLVMLPPQDRTAEEKGEFQVAVLFENGLKHTYERISIAILNRADMGHSCSLPHDKPEISFSK